MESGTLGSHGRARRDCIALAKEAYKKANAPLKEAYDKANQVNVDLLNARLAQIAEEFKYLDN